MCAVEVGEGAAVAVFTLDDVEFGEEVTDALPCVMHRARPHSRGERLLPLAARRDKTCEIGVMAFLELVNPPDA